MKTTLNIPSQHFPGKAKKFKVDDTVEFIYKKVKRQGKIVKIRTRAIVEGRGFKAYVPMTILQKI